MQKASEGRLTWALVLGHLLLPRTAIPSVGLALVAVTRDLDTCPRLDAHGGIPCAGCDNSSSGGTLSSRLRASWVEEGCCRGSLSAWEGKKEEK
jgi:hypothetical protein